MWEVEYTNEFGEWWDTLTEEQQDQIVAVVEVLQRRGPALGRPLADTIKASRHKNMKELRVSKTGVLRILFAFDPLRTGILLLGGNKEGLWSEWYALAVPRADALYDDYLAELRREGKLR